MTQAVKIAALLLLLVGAESCASNQVDENPIPVSKVDLSLIDVYEEYRLYQKKGETGTPFRTNLPLVRVVDEYIDIDAIAIDKAQELKQELEHIGAVRLAVAGSYVSCRLPISSIARLGRLNNLKFARPAMTITHN